MVPYGALKRLQKSTKIFLNISLRYGTVGSPVEGRHMCYHPKGGTEWLRSNGLSVTKAGCVEMSRVDDYMGSRELWGEGGLILHELSHAYHDQLCEGGYDCPDIIQVIAQGVKDVSSRYQQLLLLLLLLSCFTPTISHDILT
jgi:hypothetical protein